MEEMRYTWNSSEMTLSISLPDNISFNFEFLKMSTKMFHIIDSTPCETVIVKCSSSASYDKLSKAYLYNILLYISRGKTVRWNSELKSRIESTVHSKNAKNFEPIGNLAEKVQSQELNLYRFKGDADIDLPINELTKLMTEKNLVFNAPAIREFLSTTIGEIFSNSIYHSQQDEFFFMFDVVYEPAAEKFFMYVNINDYGRTIVENVNSFLEAHSKPTKAGKDCIEWAIQRGNTTRSGSGGYGLPTLIDYIKEVHGDLFIFSGNAYYRLENGQEGFLSNSDSIFQGTSVTFKVALLDTENVLKFDPELKRVKSISLECI